VLFACHDAAPTLSLLMHRNIAQSAICTHCNQQEETFLHCIRDCPHSFRIWRRMGFNTDAFFAENSTYVWLKNGLTVLVFMISQLVFGGCGVTVT
jgi:hypothetical protein